MPTQTRGHGKPVEIATRRFDNQSAATAFFKTMLGRYAPGERVSEDDALDLAALLERHPERATKVGCGLDHFELMLTEYGNPCFRIVRKDGTGTDFSYLSCVKGCAPSQKQTVCGALRYAVRHDIYHARNAFFKAYRGDDGLVKCAVSGQRIPPEWGHIDHRPPMTFEVIVTTFLAMRGLTYQDIPVSDGTDEQVVAEILDTELVEAFGVYHARVARLDFVSRSINLAQSSQHRMRFARIAIGERV